MRGLVALGFDAIAAYLHIAPAARMIFAGIHEKPLAGLAAAGPHSPGIFAGQQTLRDVGEHPQRKRASLSRPAGRSPSSIGMHKIFFGANRSSLVATGDFFAYSLMRDQKKGNANAQNIIDPRSQLSASTFEHQQEIFYVTVSTLEVA